jgi:hypothetical protein
MQAAPARGEARQKSKTPREENANLKFKCDDGNLKEG